MNVTITPGLLRGRLTPPPSKSESHRLIIGAALCEGVSTLSNMAYSEDIEATIACMTALGASFVTDGSTLHVTGLRKNGKLPEFNELPRLDCGESGSTLRFLIPVALAVAGGGVFSGRGRLMQRPQTPYETLFRAHGIAFESTETALTVRGQLNPGTFSLPGNVSSQFFTGLLYALPLLGGDSQLISTTAQESASYLDMTLEALSCFGIRCKAEPDRFFISGNNRFYPADNHVGADWSNGAFWLAANYLGSAVEICGLDTQSAQGDRAIWSFADRMKHSGSLELNVSDCPDLVPPIAAMAALRVGETTQIVGAARLRIKESDRLKTVTETLRALGAQIDEQPESLRIEGVAALHGGIVDGCNDHRIAMMAAIAATRASDTVTITGAQCVNKSYPDFWRDFQALGGKIQ